MGFGYEERPVREVMADTWHTTEDRLYYLCAISEEMSSGGRGLNISGYRDLLRVLEENRSNQDFSTRGCEVLSRVRRLGWEIEQRFRARPGSADHQINHAGFMQMARPVFERLPSTTLQPLSLEMRTNVILVGGRPVVERATSALFYQI